ncbi:Protein angel 2 [Dinochytrium kinnereticum]|nr:Protein angel 2 [Dinochytrium kinnereticum]
MRSHSSGGGSRGDIPQAIEYNPVKDRDSSQGENPKRRDPQDAKDLKDGKRHKPQRSTPEQFDEQNHYRPPDRRRHGNRWHGKARTERHDHRTSGQVWVNSHVDRRRLEGNIEFTVLSYNVLADSLVKKNPGLYTFCEADHLAWASRGPRLIQEILKNEADFVCLQEVDQVAYEDIFKPQLVGYQGFYKKRLGNHTDGCALFWKTARVQTQEVHPLDYFAETSKENVGIAGRIAELSNHEIPTIVCGDLNLLPHSYLYKYIHSGEADAFLIEENMMSGQTWSSPSSERLDSWIAETKRCQEKGSQWLRYGRLSENTPNLIIQANGLMKNPLPYMSALPHKCKHTGHQYYTTWHKGAKQMVDVRYKLQMPISHRLQFIFYSQPASKATLHVLSHFKPPTGPFLTQIPSEKHPSDHFPVQSRFSILAKRLS